MKNIGYSYNGFTTARLKRFLNTGGQSFTFIGTELNEFGEPTETISDTKQIWGVLHTSSSYSMTNSSSSTASSKIRSESGFSIITSWESLVSGFSGGKELSPDMTVVIDNSIHKIIKVDNIHNWGLIAEISLEEQDEWKH